MDTDRCLLVKMKMSRIGLMQYRHHGTSQHK